MEIGFPLEVLGKKAMATDFHRCKGIGSYNIITKEFKEIDIRELTKRYGSVNLSSVLMSMGINQVICHKIKPMALKFFNDQDITVYKAQSSIIDLNIELLKDNQLNSFDAQMAESVGCGSSCSSCSSGCK